MIKTAVVTGASRGIGLEIAKALLDNNYYCVVTARNTNDNLLALTSKYGDKCTVKIMDISISSDRESLVRDIIDKFGAIDVLVNNAGVAPRIRKDMLDIVEEDFDYVMDINLKGTYFITQSLSKIMNLGGKIINIGSISAESVSTNRAEYCIAKAGISMITSLFAVRMAEKEVSVFEVRPGVIDTDMINSVRDKYNALASSGVIPIRRLGKPEDVARIVMSLASGSFDYATGSIIECGGGLHIKTL